MISFSSQQTMSKPFGSSPIVAAQNHPSITLATTSMINVIQSMKEKSQQLGSNNKGK